MLETNPISEITPAKYKDFTCGEVVLDEYLKRYAKNNHKKGFGKTFVLLLENQVVGYYTISMGNIEFGSIPFVLQRGVPRYPIPIARIGRLAVATHVKGQGLGKFLLIDAIYRISEAAKMVAAYGVVVDAKDNRAKSFYQYFGFIPFADNEMSLFLPLDTFQTNI